MRLRLVFFLAFVAAVLFVPASSFAAQGQLTNCDINGENCTMVYTGDPGESNAAVLQDSTFTTDHFEVIDPNADITPQIPCFAGDNSHEMECPKNLVASFSASLGDGNDSLTVTANLPASIGGGGGGDTIVGGPASDPSLRGGDGADTIDGGGGSDTLYGDNPDTLGPADGGDVLMGGPGADVEFGEAGNDTFVAQSTNDGADTLVGGDGIDTASYAARTTPQRLSIDGVNNDGPPGQSGDDIQTNVENVIGGAAGDTISGSPGDNALSGGGGDDSIAGAQGVDTINGGDGNDVEDAGDGFDVVNGDGGSDTLMGDGGDDTMNGGDGDDTLAGGDNHDVLAGDAGNDHEDGGGGPDTMAGGDGNDALDGGDDGDTMSGDAGSDTLSGGAGGDNVSGGGDADALSGGDGDDSLDGGTGDDNLDGGTGGDAIRGGDGVDGTTYAARSARVAVSLDGKPGDGELGENDNVQADVENVTGGSGADTFLGSAAANTLDGGGGEDYEDGGAGADQLVGGESGDVFRTRGSTQGATITCGPGPDFVVAKASDTVSPDCDRVDRGVRQKPKRRNSAVVAPAGGTLQMSPTGIVRRVPLQDKVVLPLRSIVDTVAGTVRVTTAPKARTAETIKLFEGAFDITQTAAKLAVTQFALKGGDFAACPAALRGRGVAHTAASKPIRRLWASGKGRFRTRGNYAAAVVRGTKWLTEDRCDGTLIRVSSGAVTVRDLVAKKTVVVKAGRSYFASATRRRR